MGPFERFDHAWCVAHRRSLRDFVFAFVVCPMGLRSARVDLVHHRRVLGLVCGLVDSSWC